jgi:FKBP-type peptidyl-prolyl cis-trans isomerase FkpA
MHKILAITFLILILTPSCRHKKNNLRQDKEITMEDIKDPSIDANIRLIKQESDNIDQYVKRHEYNMTKTGTGLRYMIYKKGTGEQAVTGKRAKISYQISLLDGTKCYSSDKSGLQEFMIGQDNVESGLHEGLTYMHVGDKAIFILPSYMAHGLTGDQDKIPPRSSVVYDIELISLR